ncbi:MAG: CPBP family intramembrane metalloprotease [Dehalococcoidia bacterium]|nr:CPBP family intramembrane metalloprotease [Dehalococcoidia bacterium]
MDRPPDTASSPARRWVAERPLLAYFALAFAISWLLWLPVVATVQGWWDVEVARWWHYSGAAGPIVAAVAVSALTGGGRGVRALLAQYSPRRGSPRWLAFAVGMPVALFGVAAVVIRLVDGSWPTYDELASTDNLPFSGVPLVLLAHVATYGLGEETGWRGFALPRLQSDHGAMRATHLLTIPWALWHIPTFFENESMMEMSPFEIGGWLAGLWMGAIFMTWLYNSSGGSLLAVVASHGLYNLFSASNASSLLPMIETIGVIAVAIVAIRLAGTENLTGFTPHGRRQQVRDDRGKASRCRPGR